MSERDGDDETPATGSPGLGPATRPDNPRPRPEARPERPRPDPIRGPRSLTPRDTPRDRDVPRNVVPGLPAQVPTLKTLSAQFVGLAGQVHGTRHDVDTTIINTEEIRKLTEQVLGEIKTIRKHLLTDPQVLRLPPLPMPSQLTPPSGTSMFGNTPASTPAPGPPPSLRVRASDAAKQTGKLTGQVGKWITFGIGAATVLMQLAAPLFPKYSGPLVQILRLLAGEPPTP